MILILGCFEFLPKTNYRGFNLSMGREKQEVMRERERERERERGREGEII